MPSGSKKRVLIVDDDGETLSLVRRLFILASYEVEVAEGGQTAIECLERDASRTAVVTDKDMPNVDGFHVARRAHELNPALPVVMMTAHGARLPKEAIRDIDAYVPKPFRTPMEIVDAVDQAIRMRESKMRGEKTKRALDDLKNR
jgi:DNA-binding NtrC family response regulator